jgi:hypothetical protein
VAREKGKIRACGGPARNTVLPKERRLQKGPKRLFGKTSMQRKNRGTGHKDRKIF